MSQRGFTLIEMAMVMIVVGLMVGGGLFALGPVVDKARVNQTNATLDQVENALVLFVIRNNGRLPCPADGKLANTDGNYGLEAGAPGACTAATANAVIPWRSMGLDESYSLDGWGTRLSYWPSGLNGMGSDVTTAPNVSRTNGWPAGTYMTVTDVGSTPHQTATPPAPNVSDRAAYVLVSHGKSHWYGWAKSGAVQALTYITPPFGLSYKACNSDPTSATCTLGTFASGTPLGRYPPPPTFPTYFDDIVRWRSPAMIIQLCGSGSCGNPS